MCHSSHVKSFREKDCLKNEPRIRLSARKQMVESFLMLYTQINLIVLQPGASLSYSEHLQSP